MLKRPWLLFAAALAALLFIVAIRFIAPRSDILLPPRASNGGDYILYVHVPDRCRRGAPCPALYILDGERWLPTFTQLSEDAAARRAMRPIILVGIGYRDVFGAALHRKHDFTPAFGRAPGKTGGADDYLEALRRDLIPYAEAHLPIDASERGVAGHSYGGLLATYALLHAPDLFDEYLIVSPPLWYDGARIFALGPAPAHKPRTVYLASNSPNASETPMTGDVRRLNDILLRDRTLTVSQSVFLNKSHDEVAAPAARAALPLLFALD
jgi:predicted alpha/beta superfamily hydrolase